MNRGVKTVLFLFVMLIAGCREVYYPGGLETGLMIPVITGQILENQYPFISLTWAIEYEQDEAKPISGADVSIETGSGSIFSLSYYGNGGYSTNDPDAAGRIGETYTLRIQLPDGRQFVSTPETMPGKPDVVTVYAEPRNRTFFSYNDQGKPIETTYKGLDILTDVVNYTGGTRYFRIHTRVLEESTYQLDPFAPFPITVYSWRNFQMNGFYNADYSKTVESVEVIREHPAGFLRYTYFPQDNSEIRTAAIINCWVLTHRVYSISPAAYQYYVSLDRQLNSNDQLFSPIPSQVRSNIQPYGETSGPVIGIFEASSFATVYKAFKWIDFNRYGELELESFPESIPGGEQTYLPPWFWVNL